MWRKSPPQTCISSATCQKTASAHSTLQGANLQPFNSHFVLEKVYEKSCTIALASSIRETNSLVTNESCDNAEISDVKQVADIVALCPTPCVQLSRNCKAPHTPRYPDGQNVHKECTLTHRADNRKVPRQQNQTILSHVESTYWISESSIRVSGRGLKLA